MVLKDISIHDYAKNLVDSFENLGMISVRDLFFLEPVFHPGLNVTVRNGDKWMQTNIGDGLLIKKTGEDTVIHTADLIAKAYVPFRLIPEAWLAYEHDPACRTLEGLFEYGMKPAYPDFTEDNYVTVLLFWI